MNLQELKENLHVKTDMTYIYFKIKTLASGGEQEVYFNQNEISEVQVAILREQGYDVSWNRACLWYEVSGW